MIALAKIVQPGLATMVQDLGRPAQRHLGVPLSGGADPVSLALANAAAGNSDNTPALECTIKGPVLTFEKNVTFAMAGADMAPRLNGAEAPLYQPIEAKAGDTLELAASKTGARMYIAFQGGVAGDRFLGGVSTYLPAAIGGFQGRLLRAGDTLYSADRNLFAPREIPPSMRAILSNTFVLRATRGPETDSFKGSEYIFGSRWTVGRRASRMGAQLEGTALKLEQAPPMASSPVFPGTVQCPPDGAPFLLLADAQTVGGYPRIAQVIAADLHLAGQLRPGGEVWFRRISPEDARETAYRKAALFEGFLPRRLFL
ncbi:biotin-dependent carboxyltransferase family protein [Hyphococcus sp.]|uniref:5-oxoprolinase subunit C family protein n=1 Tax=Hyphococcus sp. TaxID=2038636 RepID=UPI003CCBE59C